MPQHVRYASCNMFADDNSLYVSGPSFPLTKGYFQDSVYDASLWYRNNRLPVNTLKTLCMVSASTRKLTELNQLGLFMDITFDSEILDQVENCPYLGLCLDNDLKWDSQIQRICKNTSYKLYLLCLLVHSLLS